MKPHTPLLLCLLFSSLISFSYSSNNCAILTGKDGTDTAGGSIPSKDGFRHGVSLNIAAGSQVYPRYLYSDTPAGSGFGIDYFYFTSSSENVVKQLLFSGQVIPFVGNGTAGFHDGQGTLALFNNPKGISSYHTYAFIADYGNMKIRSLDDTSSTHTVYDFSGVMYPLAVYVGSKGVYVLGDNHNGTGQSIALVTDSISSATVVVHPISAFSTGQCSSITQDAVSPFNVYFGCGSKIKKYNATLTHISDFSTSFNNISSIFIDINGPSGSPLYVADSGANAVYIFNTTNDSKSLVAGSGAVYNRSKDTYSTTNCVDISFNTILSVSATRAKTLIMLTTTNIYVEVQASPPSYPNVPVARTPSSSPNILPNVITLDFNSYNESDGVLSATLNFRPDYEVLALTLDIDFVLADFILHWWEVNSTNVQNVTLLGNQILTLDYDFTNISNNLYYIKVQYQTTAGLSIDTTYQFGAQTKLISGSVNQLVWTQTAADGVGSDAQYTYTIDYIAFDPVISLFYFCDLSVSVVRSISLSDGTEEIVAGQVYPPNTYSQTMTDGFGLNATFTFPANAVFDPVNRLLYITDGGNLNINNGALRSIDVDNGYYVRTISIPGFSVYIFALTINNVGNLYIYGSDSKWYYITKSGSTYTISSNHTDTTFTDHSTNQVYWTQGGICSNSGVSTCLVVQDTHVAPDFSATYGPIYTVTTDTFVATLLNLGNYVFSNIGVSQTGEMGVYSIVMGFGMYVKEQNTIAWFGGDDLSIQEYLSQNYLLDPTFNFDMDVNESYTYQYAAFAQYDMGHGSIYYTELLYPITFDSHGSAYLFDTYNFRQYLFSTPFITTNTTSTTTNTSAIEKLTAYCYNLTISVSKALQGTPQYFTFQDFGCNTTDWNIVSVNTTTLYSYQDPNQVKLSIQPSMSGVRAVHYQIMSSDNRTIHTVKTHVDIVNHNPVIINSTFTWVYPRSTTTFPNWNLLSGCSDPDGDSLSVVQIEKTPARAASTVVQLNSTLLYFISEKVVLSVLPTGEISLTSPSTSNPVTSGSPLPLFWNKDLSFQFQITDGDVNKQYAWGTATINSIALN